MPTGNETIELLDPATTAALGGGLSLAGLGLSLLLIAAGQILLWLRLLRARIGFDEGWAADRHARLLRSAGGFGLALVLLHWLGSQAGTLWTALGLLVLVTALTVSGTLQDAVAGLRLQFRLRLREGDRIRVGQHSGELRSMHWDHVCLDASDGDTVYLPNHVLMRDAVDIYPLRGAVPLQMTLPAAQVTDLSRLRDRIATLPYRVAGTPVRVLPRGDHVELECVLWSEEARAATEHELAQGSADDAPES